MDYDLLKDKNQQVPNIHQMWNPISYRPVNSPECLELTIWLATRGWVDLI